MSITHELRAAKVSFGACALARELLDAGQAMPEAQLADKLKVSDRTIRRYLRELYDYIDENPSRTELSNILTDLNFDSNGSENPQDTSVIEAEVSDACAEYSLPNEYAPDLARVCVDACKTAGGRFIPGIAKRAIQTALDAQKEGKILKSFTLYLFGVVRNLLRISRLDKLFPASNEAERTSPAPKRRGRTAVIGTPETSKEEWGWEV